MFSRNFRTEIVVEGFRDKVFFDAEISALVRALGDKNYNVRRRAVNFFTATIAQGTLSCFHGVSY